MKDKMKNIKKILKVLIIIMIIITLFMIAKTYARYFTLAQAQTSNQVSNWLVKVNGMDIYSETGETKSITINKLTASNTDVIANKIAPGSKGHAYIEIDPNQTQVAIKYDIEFDFSSLEGYNLVFEGTVNNRENTLIKTGKNKYTGIIKYGDIQSGKKDIIDCAISWINNEENNKKDAEIGSIYGQKINLVAKVTVVQYLGEQIVEYTE